MTHARICRDRAVVHVTQARARSSAGGAGQILATSAIALARACLAHSAAERPAAEALGAQLRKLAARHSQ